jgi:hypothetical protein
MSTCPASLINGNGNGVSPILVPTETSGATGAGYGSALPMTYAECVPYMCGADPFNYSARYSCSNAGFQGVKSCLDPECAPYCPNSQIAPAVEAAAATLHFQPRLTAQNLVRPIPAITNPLRAIPLPNLSPWCEFNQAIADHPVISAGVLIGLYWMFSKGGNRGRR